MTSFTIGPLLLTVEQARWLAAFVVALAVGLLAGRRKDEPGITDRLFNLALIGLVTARLTFVLRYAASYAEAPLAIVDIRDGGFDSAGGLIGVAAYASYSVWRSPRLRAPLGAALGAGLLVWLVAGALQAVLIAPERRLPAIELVALDGEPLPSAALLDTADGRPLVINLWASWCPPCRAEMPLLARAQRQREDLRFVFVNQGESAAKVRDFLATQGLALEHVLRDPTARLGHAVGSAGLPTTLFYDGDGRLVDSHVGLLSQASLAAGLEAFDSTPTLAPPEPDP